MKLVAATCCNCERVIGYVTEDCLQLPTLCICCAADPEVMEEWQHEIKPGEPDPLKELPPLVLRARSKMIQDERRREKH